ncbi:MAG: 16S rRNA (cytosine(1402)-N(4))-methyltransferase RsmH [Bacteroidota bacterium]|nr:16S rRNA (cytosine(1402)-N(4))-methyltransferase RsmH [Bacteroidota bacterium]
MFHKSVLIKESIDALDIHPSGIYADATYGGGGHSREILSHLQDGKLFAFDQDEEALANKIDDPRITLINSNFRYIRNFMKLYRAIPVDGILADLGVSSHQFDIPERGFSTRFEGELDMRMDQRQEESAKDIINRYDESKIAEILSRYGEIRNAGKAAKLIFNARKSEPINTTSRLKEILTPCTVKGSENKFFAQVFQALRIEVNQELEALKEFLEQSVSILRPGGKLVIISYHSLEDRLVKDYFRSGNFEGEIKKDFFGNPIVPLKIITRKPVVPSSDEVMKNPRARSGRMRVAEKI